MRRPFQTNKWSCLRLLWMYHPGRHWISATFWQSIILSQQSVCSSSHPPFSVAQPCAPDQPPLHCISDELHQLLTFNDCSYLSCSHEGFFARTLLPIQIYFCTQVHELYWAVLSYIEHCDLMPFGLITRFWKLACYLTLPENLPVPVFPALK